MKTNVLTKFFSISMTIMTLTAMENNNQINYLEQLPRGLKEKVFSLLEPRDLDALACSSKKNCYFLNAYAADMVKDFFPSEEFNKKLSEYNKHFGNKKKTLPLILRTFSKKVKEMADPISDVKIENGGNLGFLGAHAECGLPYNMLNFPLYWLASCLDESFQTFQGVSFFKNKILLWAKSIKPIQSNDLEALNEQLFKQNLSSKLIIKNISKKNISKISDFTILLNNNPKITSLKITQKRIWDDKVIKHLVEALEKNQTIKSLDLSSNGIEDEDEEAVKAIANLLQKNQSIKSMNLSGNKISFKGLTILASPLKKNKSLTSINLEGNCIAFQRLNAGNQYVQIPNSEGIKVFAKALKENKSIIFLSLRNNVINDECLTAFSEGIKKNESIKCIDLENNRFTAKGIKAFAEALKENKSLMSINLQENDLRDEGAKELIEALKVNKAINSLDMRKNDISHKYLKLFYEIFKENNATQSINFLQSSYSEDIFKKLFC